MNDEKQGTNSIHGRENCPTDERVRLAVEAGGYSIVAARQYRIGERWFDEVTIEHQGRRYVGSTEIRFGGSGSDATAPLETAETAAVGRALGFAGLGIVDGSASTEDVAHGHGVSVVHPIPEISTGILAPTDAQRKKAHLEARRIGEAKARAHLEKTFGATTTSELTRRQMSALIDWLTHQPAMPARDETAALGLEHP